MVSFKLSIKNATLAVCLFQLVASATIPTQEVGFNNDNKNRLQAQDNIVDFGYEQPVAEESISSGSSSKPIPVVIWHGMGDNFDSAGMKRTTEVIQSVRPGTFVYLVRLDNDSNKDAQASLLGKVDEQVSLYLKFYDHCLKIICKGEILTSLFLISCRVFTAYNCLRAAEKCY